MFYPTKAVIILLATIITLTSQCGFKGDQCIPYREDCCNGFYCGKNGGKDYTCNYLLESIEEEAKELFQSLEKRFEEFVGCKSINQDCRPDRRECCQDLYCSVNGGGCEKCKTEGDKCDIFGLECCDGYYCGKNGGTDYTCNVLLESKGKTKTCINQQNEDCFPFFKPCCSGFKCAKDGKSFSCNHLED